MKLLHLCKNLELSLSSCTHTHLYLILYVLIREEEEKMILREIRLLLNEKLTVKNRKFSNLSTLTCAARNLLY